MDVLAVALRSLDPIAFEQLVTALLKARYPELDIRHIDGQGGDGGADILCEDPVDGRTIWECKAFRNGVKNSQKEQIKNSLKTAYRNYAPRKWILCLTVDLDPAAFRWWQNLRKSYESKVELELLPASDLVQHLTYHNSVRERFFPWIQNVPAGREATAKSDTLTDEQLRDLNDQNLDAYLARLEKTDPRFSYEVSVARNQQPSAPPGDALFSIRHKNRSIHVKARDRDAIAKCPPVFEFTVKERANDKVLEATRTGRPARLTSEELGSFNSSFDFLHGRGPIALIRMEITPQKPSDALPLRVTFGSGAGAIVYDYILFEVARAGTEEYVLESKTPLPFAMSIVCQTGVGTLNFEEKCSGHNVERAARMATAIVTAISEGVIDFFHLEEQKRFFKASLGGPIPDWLAKTRAFLEATSQIAQAYGADLTLPAAVSEQDRLGLALLENLRTEGLLVDVHSVTISKGDVLLDEVPDPVRLTIDIQQPEFAVPIVVFGERIHTGPVHCHAEDAQIRDRDEYLEFMSRAPIGARARFLIEPPAKMCIRRVTRDASFSTAG